MFCENKQKNNLFSVPGGKQVESTGGMRSAEQAWRRPLEGIGPSRDALSGDRLFDKKLDNL